MNPLAKILQSWQQSHLSISKLQSEVVAAAASTAQLRSEAEDCRRNSEAIRSRLEETRADLRKEHAERAQVLAHLLEAQANAGLLTTELEALRDELDRAKIRERELRLAANDHDALLFELKARAERLSSEAKQLRSTNLSMKAELLGLRTDYLLKAKEVDGLQTDVQRLEGDLREHLEFRRAILCSGSWRITAPARALVHFFRTGSFKIRLF